MAMGLRYDEFVILNLVPITGTEIADFKSEKTVARSPLFTDLKIVMAFPHT